MENAAGADAVGMVGAAEVMAADTEAAEAEVMVVDTEEVEVIATAVTGAAAVVGTVVVAAGGAVAGTVGAGPAGFGGRLLAGFGLARATGQVLLIPGNPVSVF